jgi:hypothetical protein
MFGTTGAVDEVLCEEMEAIALRWLARKMPGSCGTDVEDAVSDAMLAFFERVKVGAAPARTEAVVLRRRAQEAAQDRAIEPAAPRDGWT